ncbi:unnamed protein product [Rhodiola kirilowii]
MRARSFHFHQIISLVQSQQRNASHRLRSILSLLFFFPRRHFSATPDPDNFNKFNPYSSLSPSRSFQYSLQGLVGGGFSLCKD